MYNFFSILGATFRMSRSITKGQIHSVISGLFAALASLCGKYAMASTEALDLCENMIDFLNDDLGFSALNVNNELCIQVIFKRNSYLLSNNFFSNFN